MPDMAVTLLRDPTFVSLEFAFDDREAVLSAIRELFGSLTVAERLASASVEVAG
ncbi:MAG: hypothetical protein J0J06_02170 [Sphingomonas sp.]|nr:hypothetical protein [Sphingomonas sp.]